MKRRACALFLACLMAAGCLNGCGQSASDVKESEAAVEKES